MNKEETAKFIQSIIKEVNKMTELTKQLQANIDNAPIVKHYNKSTNKWIAYKKVKTNVK